MKKIVTSFEDLKALQGQTIGISPDFLINPAYVSDFSQSVHMPSTYDQVPDFLLLSLTPHLWKQIIDIRNTKMIINYGLPEVRFLHKAVIGENIRLMAKIDQVNQKLGMTKLEIDFTIESCNRDLKCIEGKAVFLYYFNDC